MRQKQIALLLPSSRTNSKPPEVQLKLGEEMGGEGEESSLIAILIFNYFLSTNTVVLVFD